MTPEEMARRLIGERALLDEAGVMHAATREEAAEVFGPGDRKDLGDLGMVYVTKPKGAWKVVDQNALFEWLSEHAPQYIVERVVREVSPLILRQLDEGRLPDADGELVEVPGVEQVMGRPTLTVKPSAKARAAVRESLIKAVEA